MHIAEGILSVEVLAVGAAGTAAGVGLGLRRLRTEDVPKAALLASAFFIAGFIRVPIAGASVHLVLNALAGLLLGWAAFPSILIALLLQAGMFGFGGLTTLGVNTLTMALPAVLCYYLFNLWLRRAGLRSAFVIGFVAAAFCITTGALLIALAMCLSGHEFATAAALICVAHLPVVLIEGLVTGSIVVFLKRVRPEIFALKFGASGSVVKG
jgi:cobalt/nickel transport system permease protein